MWKAMSHWKFGYYANCWEPLGDGAIDVMLITQFVYRTLIGMAPAIGEACYGRVEPFDGNLLDWEVLS